MRHDYDTSCFLSRKTATLQNYVMVLAWLTAALNSSSLPANPNPLTLGEAVALAVEQHDPRVLRHGERAAALEHRAVAESQLPDPEIRVGLANWPTDSFDYEQEAMTQIQAGVRQRFPRGQTLSIMGSKRESEAAVERARQRLEVRQIARATRETWLELQYLDRARGIVRQSRAVVVELVDVVQAGYATGLGNTQELLRAELELSILDDRALDIDRQAERYRADLERLIRGDDAARPLAPDAVAWPPIPEVDAIDELVLTHPAALVGDAAIEVRNRDVAIAHEQYRPGWALEAGYGARGAGQSDFASVMLTVDVPLFPEKRQDERLIAAQRERTATVFERDATLLDLRQQARRAIADARRFTARRDLYRQVVLSRADDTAQAARDGYQSRVSDFAELIRARLAALDAGLRLARIETDVGRAHAELMYLLGER